MCEKRPLKVGIVPEFVLPQASGDYLLKGRQAPTHIVHIGVWVQGVWAAHVARLYEHSNNNQRNVHFNVKKHVTRGLFEFQFVKDNSLPVPAHKTQRKTLTT